MRPEAAGAEPAFASWGAGILLEAAADMAAAPHRSCDLSAAVGRPADQPSLELSSYAPRARRAIRSMFK
ncbi:hypothetical protein GCM10010512_42010 [Streptomyces thermoviolaceus subsp. thermoviolaceus]|nr:hypothetical protein GCM10010512_42010 [Streptomyces thermoviolaceus subsp. thermoviolaceus]